MAEEAGGLSPSDGGLSASLENRTNGRASRLARSQYQLVLFGVTAFTAAALVFLVQPMVARMVLPDFGGAASAWITAMLFFQLILLAGYGYAHISVRLFGRRQPFAQLALIALAAAALPVGRHLSAPPDDVSPNVWLLAVLLLSVGAPFFVVTTAHRRFSAGSPRGGHESSGDPYFLYAASNAGSLLAPLAYPLLVEPRLSLGAQADAWTLGYVCFAVLSLVCVALARPWVERPRAAERASSVKSLTWAMRVRWVAMAFVPSSLLLAVTTFITTDVAVHRPSRLALSVAALLVLSLVGANTVHRERTFFGVLDVVEIRSGTYALRHGTTLHGAQRQGPGARDFPSATPIAGARSENCSAYCSDGPTSTGSP
jgi:hypothetical protein